MGVWQDKLVPVVTELKPTWSMSGSAGAGDVAGCAVAEGLAAPPCLRGELQVSNDVCEL